MEEPDITKLDLFAKVERADFCTRAPGAYLFLHIYKLQRLSNGTSETWGRLANIISNGVRQRMGPVTIENLIRLHYTPPMETSEFKSFCRQVARLWIQSGGQLAVCRKGTKRKLKETQSTILPIRKGKSNTSKSIQARRTRMLRLSSLVSG